MADTMFKDLFNELESGSFTSAIPAGVYDVVVTDARPEKNNHNVIFLTMQVLDGPAQGKSTEITFNIPKDGDKPFTFTKFKQRLFGFAAYPDVKAAFEASPNAPSREALLDLFAGALVGKKVKADVGLRGSDAGQYAGSNELNATQPPQGGATPTTPAETQVVDNGAPANSAAPF